MQLYSVMALLDASPPGSDSGTQALCIWWLSHLQYVALTAALPLGSISARQQGKEQEKLWMGGVYEPDPSVGSSTLIPLVHSLITRYHCKGGWGIEFSCVTWKKRRWIWWFSLRQGDTGHQILRCESSWVWGYLANNLDQASSLPSPSPPLALGGLSQPRFK